MSTVIRTYGRCKRTRLPRLGALVLGVSGFLATIVGAQAKTTKVYLRNHTGLPRFEWMKASIPFAPGTQREPIQKNIGGRPTNWRVLQRWTDGSVRIAQAQAPSFLAPYEVQSHDVRKGTIPTGPFQLHPAVAAALPKLSFATVVRDPYAVPYYAIYTPTTHKDQEVLEVNDTTICVRARAYHRNPSNKGIGRDYLTQTMYLTLFKDLPYAFLDVIVANDYKGADRPNPKDPNENTLGDVNFKSIDFYSAGCEAYFRYAGKNRLLPAQLGVLGKGSSYTKLLGSGYFSDAQGKRWRAVLWFDSPNFTQKERFFYKASAAAQVDAPMIPVADWNSWKRSYALGLFGSTVDPEPRAKTNAVEDYMRWTGKDHFGPMGGWGESKATATTGTPRNGPHSEFANLAAQTGYSYPLLMLEGRVWQQSLRPYHLWKFRVEPKDDIYTWDGLPYRMSGGRRISQETLGRYPLSQKDPYAAYRKGIKFDEANGWRAYDVEHFTMDDLFDYWTFTGDHVAKAEMVNLAECLMGALRPFKYFSATVVLSARAEGWCAQAMVKAYLATGDERYKRHIVDRIHNLVDKGRQKQHPSRALVFQNSHGQTRFPNPHRFFMPWQHAALVYGYMGVWYYMGDPVARGIAHDVIHCVVYSWVTNFKDPKYGLVKNGLRYFTPVEYNYKPVPANYFDKDPKIGVRWGDSPLGGAHTFLIGAMDLLAEDAYNETERNLALTIRTLIHNPTKSAKPSWRSQKWFFLREPKIWR